MLGTPPSQKPKAKRRSKKQRKKKRNPPAQLEPRENRERLKPISLYGLDFDKVMRGLLSVKTTKKS